MPRLLLIGLLLVAAAVDTGLGNPPHPRPRYRNGHIAFVRAQQVAQSGLAAVAVTGARRSLLLGGEIREPPVLSSDGTRIACVAGRSSPIVYVLHADGTNRVRIAPGSSPSWAPDGSHLTFVSAVGTNDIEVASADGSSVRSLGVSGLDPVWSPRGDWIAFFSSDSTLERIRPDGSGRTVLASDAERFPRNVPLAWSPDGAWLSFPAVDPSTHVLEVNVARSDGSDRRSLGNGWAATWSPTDDLLGFEHADEQGVEALEIGTPGGSVLLNSEEAEGTPAWSPDGRTLAVGAPDQKGVGIVDLRTGAVKSVAIHGVPAWSHDTARIAAISGTTLRVAPVRGGRARVVAQGATGVPLWLRNGRIAYDRLARVRSVVESAAERGSARILLGGPARFTPTRRGPPPTFTALAWSPDGRRLAFVREVAHGAVLGVVPSNGRGADVLAHGAVTGTPTWSPDGKQIAFAANGLAVIDSTGGQVHRLTSGDDEVPEWSPDGRRIAFVRSGSSAGGLYVVNPTGRHLRRLTDDISSAPSWSPNGRRIAYAIGGDYAPTAIETIRPNGTGRRVPVAAPAAEETGDVLSEPSWSPDGRTILYYDDEYFCGSKCDELHLMLMRPDGSNRHTLPFTVDDATWSPDSRQLLGQDDATGTLVAVEVQSRSTRFTGPHTEAWSWQPGLRSTQR